MSERTRLGAAEQQRAGGYSHFQGPAGAYAAGKWRRRDLLACAIAALAVLCGLFPDRAQAATLPGVAFEVGPNLTFQVYLGGNINQAGQWDLQDTANWKETKNNPLREIDKGNGDRVVVDAEYQHGANALKPRINHVFGAGNTPAFSSDTAARKHGNAANAAWDSVWTAGIAKKTGNNVDGYLYGVFGMHTAGRKRPIGAQAVLNGIIEGTIGAVAELVRPFVPRPGGRDIGSEEFHLGMMLTDVLPEEISSAEILDPIGGVIMDFSPGQFVDVLGAGSALVIGNGLMSPADLDTIMSGQARLELHTSGGTMSGGFVPTMIPEPCSLALLATGALGCVRRRW